MSSFILTSKPRYAWFFFFLSGLLATAFIVAILIWTCVDETTIMRYKRDMLDYKLDRLRTANRPNHLIIVSGSNGLYSINSQTLSTLIKKPVTNLAMHWALGLYAAERLAEVIIPGDSVLMPLEYTYYTDTGQAMHWEEACFLLAHDRQSIDSLASWGKVLMQCKPKMMLGGIGLKWLSLMGIQYPRYPMDQVLNEYGDITENRALAKGHSQVGFSTPEMTDEQIKTHYPRLEKIIAALQKQGAKVYLSFPVHPHSGLNEPIVSEPWVLAIRQWASQHHITLLSDPKHHQFPLDCFFDSAYHLHQGCTSENSKIYANALLSES